MSLHRIIADRDERGTWHVWFADSPEMSFVSGSLFSAIDYLATLFPGERVDADALFLDDARSNERHCEFLGFAQQEPGGTNGRPRDVAIDELLRRFARGNPGGA
jgi:hypothetical protein